MDKLIFSLRQIALPLIAICSFGISAEASSQSFAVHNDHFELNGAPFQIISGELHYERIPREYWRDRLQKAKAMGLNTIATYVFWNAHEQTPGVYDFTGQNDVAEFIREAQSEGLYVMLRPGPYACGEWEFGGYPAWLLKDHSLVLRTVDAKYMKYVARWMAKLGAQLAPLQLDRGGPIITVQLENEYGAFGNDQKYLQGLRKVLLNSGFTSALMTTTDPAWALNKGSTSGALALVNFGTGGAQAGFSELKKQHPNLPLMSGEYWTGWFDDWGEPHHTGNLNQVIADLDWILSHSYSFNLYMFHGGTSFGWMSGANIDHAKYQPYVSSYDYDAPLDESGRPTLKYWAIRSLIAKYVGHMSPAPTPDKAPIVIPEFKQTGSISLWSTLPTPMKSAKPLSMEDVDQAYGYILYRKKIDLSGELVLNKVHDYAQIYLNGNQVGTIDRRLGQDRIQINSVKPNSQLDILIENSGRANYSAAIQGERKGITDNVTLAGHVLSDWNIYSFPMNNLGTLKYTNSTCTGACFFTAEFIVNDPNDTFLDTSKLGKGQVWINGKGLGRFWTDLGPQHALYLPGPWLKKGMNTIYVFDVNAQLDWSLQGLDKPNIGIEN